MTTLPEKLLLLRNERGLSQEKAAASQGIAYRSYRRYETGEREPTASVLVQMADFYGVTIMPMPISTVWPSTTSWDGQKSGLKLRPTLAKR